MDSIYCYDPTTNDPLSKVRGVGRYLQILKENFPKWKFTNDLLSVKQWNNETIFLNPFFNFLRPPLTLKKVAKKQIAVIHDLIPLKYPKHFPAGIKGRLNIFLNKIAFKKYDLIVTDSNASKRDIINILHIDENKIKVIYPCLPKVFSKIDSGVAPIKSGLPRMTKQLITDYRLPTNYCLYVGDATWNKNLVNLAKAIKIINVTCVFVGKVFSNFRDSENQKNQNNRKKINSGLLNYPANLSLRSSENSHSWLRELTEFMAETKDDKRFIFPGFVSDEKLIQLYQNARCNILMSKDEGFGFSYLEAASQKCPSILSNTPVLRETSKNRGALFAKPENPNDIANAIGEVYFNQDLRNKLGEVAKERLRHFSQNKFVSEFLKILNL